MRWKPTQYGYNGSPPEYDFVIERYTGLNTTTTATKIEDSESPDMLNIVLDAEGRPDKRFGYDRIYETSLGSGKINGLFNFVKKDGTGRFVIHHGTSLYTQSGSSQPVLLFAGVANNRSVMWAFNDFMWFMDGTNYMRYDGTTVVTVASVAYVPTLFISTPPAGGGTAFEDFNLLGPGFKQSFSGNGSATQFFLAITGLDATLVSAVVNGVVINESAGLTVDRTLGRITFTTAPATGTNNVIITAFKTVASKPLQITKCNDFVIYGGTQDTRVFWYGNPDTPATAYRSGLFDPSYAPENGFIKVGSDASAIKKMVSQYDTCIIIKGPLRTNSSAAQNINDNLIWNMSFELSNGVASFPLKPINNQINCIAIDSVQLINNTPTWLAHIGVHQLTGTNVRDERNTQHISYKIDRGADVGVIGLLDYTTLQNSVSTDFDKKYILALNDSDNTAYVFDYALGAWLKWDAIPASCFVEINNSLYFGSNSDGIVYKFKKSMEEQRYRDDGQAINAYIDTKPSPHGYTEYLKTSNKIWIHLKPDSAASVDVSYVSDYYSSPVLTPTEYVSLFDYSTWDYANFSYSISTFPQTIQIHIKAKKYMYLKIRLANPRIDEAMGVLLLKLHPALLKEAK